MTEPNEDPRIYFAAERTFLAWIRTGLALMGIGFAVARFGLFLRQLRLVPGMVVSNSGVSVHSGVALVVLGVTVNVIAAIHHVRTTTALKSGAWKPGVSRQALALSLALAAAGAGMAIYLFLLG
jgi:putative membrane protein